MAVPPPIFFIIKRMSSCPTSTNSSTGNTTVTSRFIRGEAWVGITPPNCTAAPSGPLACSSRSTRPGSLMSAVRYSRSRPFSSFIM